METNILENWLLAVKAKKLNVEEIELEIHKAPFEISRILLDNGNNLSEKAQILFNQWQKETEFSPKRGDRVLVWNDGKSFEFERIFLTKIEGTEEPIYVVAKQSETSFIGGGMFYIETYEYMKPLPTETDFKSKVIELIEKRIEDTKLWEKESLEMNRDHYAIEYRAISNHFKDFLNVVKEQL